MTLQEAQISTWLDKALVEKLRRISSDKGIFASGFVAGLIRNYKEQKKHKKTAAKTWSFLFSVVNKRGKFLRVAGVWLDRHGFRVSVRDDPGI